MNVSTRLRRLLETLGLSRKSKARARIERSLERKPASVFKRTIEDDDGPLTVYESTSLPAQSETVEVPDQAQLRALNERAEAVDGFLVAFTGANTGASWTLEELDKAFATWLTAGNKRYYSKQTVIAITGAAFGTYLVKHLGMRWLWITDADGSAWAVRDSTNTVTDFPHHTVAKRIEDSEVGFFQEVFRCLRSEVHKAMAASPNTSFERTREE